jgi:protein-S-isoprenylcysteine O-methyltransferase Ste14
MREIIFFVLLCVFWALFLGRTVLLTRRGVRVFVLAKGKPFAEKALEIALIPLLILWTLEAVTMAFGKPFIGQVMFWDSAVCEWAGIVLCAVGLAIFVAALISFGDAWRVGIDEECADRLITTGIFARSRNPIFLFMHLFFFGTFLVVPCMFFLIFFVCEFIGIHKQILNEERFLYRHFGVAYKNYCNKVRRYF